MNVYIHTEGVLIMQILEQSETQVGTNGGQRLQALNSTETLVTIQKEKRDRML
jgi:hypothetical protein